MKLYVDDDIIFGPALTEAYEAEERLAVYPRVILCQSAETPFKGPHYGWQDRPVPGVLLDSDQRVFVNYLKNTVMIAYPDDGPFTELLEQHKAAIVGNLTRFINEPRIRAKYEWVALYHNAFCNAHPDLFGESEKIPTAFLAAPPGPWIALPCGHAGLHPD